MSDLTIRSQDLWIGSLFQRVSEALIVADASTGRIVLWNGAATEIFGYSHTEALELSVEDLIPEHLRAQLRAQMVRLREAGRGRYSDSRQRLDLSAEHKEGREINIEMSLSPLGSVNDASDERLVLAIIRDVTERNRNYERLIENERRFANVLSNARAYVYRCLNEPGWPNEFASGYALELTGYSPEDLLVGGPICFGDLIVEEDRHRVWEEVQRALGRRERYNVRYDIRRRNGEIRHVEDQGQGIYDQEGNVEVLEGIVYDVTEFARTKERLKESETRYRTLVERIPAIVYVQAMNGRMASLYDSPQIEAMLGYPQDSYRQDPEYWTKILHPDDRELVLAEDRRTDETGEPFSMEYRVLASDGRVVWVRDDAILVRDEAGENHYWQGFIFDITERKEAEERLMEAEALYRSLVEQIPAVVYIQGTEHEGAVAYISPQIEEIMGYSAEEYVEDPDLWVRTTYPEDRERILAEDARSARTGEPFRAEFRKVRRDGRVIWARDEAVLVRDADGNPLYWQGIFTDITERKRTEEALQESEERFRALVQNGSDVITILEADGTIRYESPSIERTLGYRSDELVGDVAFDYIHPEDLERVLEVFVEALAEPGVNKLVEYRFRHADGSWRHLESVGSSLLDDPSVGGVIVNSRDVTERRRTEYALRESEERFRQLFEQSVDAIFVHDEKGRFVDCNSQACRLLGYTREELLDLSVYDVSCSMLTEKERTVREREGGTLWQRALVGDPGMFTLSHEEENRRKDGTTFPVEVRVGSVDYGGRRFLLSSVRDITERKVFEAQLTYQALHDSLTGLPNRTLFLDRLEYALAKTKRRQSVTVAVLFMDLDDFKNVNDSLGHEVGDELLRAVGVRLKEHLRPGDTAARLGGDEFAVLIEEVEGVEDAARVAQRIIEELRVPFAVMGYEIFFTTSIGISLSSSEKVRAEEVLRDADLAMYQAKEKGKGGYQIFDSAMYDRVLRRLSLERDLRRAIRDDEFVVHYQPKVLLETGRIVGVEALIRWESPERGLTLPQEFVPMAEELRLIVPVGREVLEEACRQASEWRERYPEDLLQMVSVNLSASQLQHPDLLREISETLQRTELDPRNLTLEITESVVMSDAPSNIATLKDLRRLGLELAIDDFGTGYSSLSYLKRFPVSYLKIDRSFVEGLRQGSDDKVVVAGIIALAHTLGMGTIAEGVETAEQLRILRQIGCDMAQGHYFSEPLAPEAISALLSANPRW